jgi:hypothetical protein
VTLGAHSHIESNEGRRAKVEYLRNSRTSEQLPAKYCVPDFSRVGFVVRPSRSRLGPSPVGFTAGGWSDTAPPQPDPPKKDAIRCRNYTCHASKPHYQVSKLYIRCSPYCSAMRQLLSLLSTYRSSQAIIVSCAIGDSFRVVQDRHLRNGSKH